MEASDEPAVGVLLGISQEMESSGSKFSPEQKAAGSSPDVASASARWGTAVGRWPAWVAHFRSFTYLMHLSRATHKYVKLTAVVEPSRVAGLRFQ